MRVIRMLVLTSVLILVAASAWAVGPGGRPQALLGRARPAGIEACQDSYVLKEDDREAVYDTSLGCSVYAGYLVLLDKGWISYTNTANWSDIVVFEAPGIKPVCGSLSATHAYLLSDTLEAGFSQAWLDQTINNQINGMGAQRILISDIVTALGNPSCGVYLTESVAGISTTYNPGGGPLYYIFSDWVPLPGVSPVGMGLLFVMLLIGGALLVSRMRRSETIA